MSLELVGMALLLLATMLIIGKWIRLKIPVLQTLFLPSSLIGGFLALALGPELLGRLGQKILFWPTKGSFHQESLTSGLVCLDY
ncbi:hypothetical protein [Bacillus sp. JCM 19041]|uniref:hypothetical protein n=1 Tax=Bacillus sp. JCM 19041 TaxID=1460637 RepID=UPI000A869DF2